MSAPPSLFSALPRPGEYRTIVADPPWHFDMPRHIATRARKGEGREPLPYTTMSVEDIAALPVRDVAAKRCHLYLWTINAYIEDAWFQWPRREHSAKPEAFLDLVESVSPEPRLEMFSRRARLGWDVWGSESLVGGEAVTKSEAAA